METNELIDNYWNEIKNIGNIYHGDKFGVCQCGTERVIQSSKDELTTRSFLLIGVLLDQLIHNKFNYFHSDFEKKFKFPKLYSHGVEGYASPEWFIYYFHGYDKKINWNNAKNIGKTLISEITEWLLINKIISDPLDFKNILLEEINRDFNQKKEITNIKQIINYSFD